MRQEGRRVRRESKKRVRAESVRGVSQREVGQKRGESQSRVRNKAVR